MQVHYVPTYRFGAYADLGVEAAAYPNTEHAYARLLSLPMFPALTDAEQDLVVETLLSIAAT